MASDIEMGDADHLSDHDSLKSTIPSSENGEYDVEEILAEREKKRNKKKSQTEYLVKWLGYPLYRSSWEPKECFQSPQTFIDWEKKKAEIEAGKKLPFNLKSFDEEKLRWENETQERKEARRIKRKQRLKLHLFPSENESNHNTGESPGEQGNDSDDGLFISTEGIGSDDSVSYGSPAQSPRTTSTTSAQSPTVNTQNPLASVQTPISTNLALEEPTRAIESKTQSAQSKIQIAGCVNPQMAQGASPEASMTKKKVQNGSKNTQSFASQSLPGFGDTSTASFRDPVRRINTKWRGRDIRWGSDRAPDASQLQLLKPTEFTPLKNPPTNTHATKTQDSNEQSNGVGGMAPEIPKPSNTRPNDPDIVSDYRSTTHVSRSSVLSGSEPTPEPRNTKAMDPNTERFRPIDQIASRKSSSQFGDSSHLAPRHGPSLAGSPHRRSIPSRLSILELQSRPNQMNVNGPISSDKPENLQGDFDFTEAEQISQMPVGKPNRDSWILPGHHFWNKGEVYAHVFYGPAKTAVGPVRICGISNEMKFDLLKSKTVNSKQCELWFRDLCNVDLYGQLCDRATTNTSLGNCWMEGFQDTNPGLFRMAQHLRQQNVLAIFYPQHQRGSVWLAHSRASSDFNFLNWDFDRIPESSPLILSVRAPLPSISSLSALANKPNAMGTFDFDDTFVGAEESTYSALGTQQVTNLAHQAETGDISAPGLSTPWLEVIPNHVLFGSKLEIKLDNLTQLNDSSRAEIFFLHFPRGKEEDEGFEKMQKWLVHNGMTVYSNRDEDGWSRFLDNSRRGVVIFYESFSDFHLLRPGIRKCLLPETFNIWRFRLRHKLQQTDPRGIYAGDHCQRLFPAGGLILVAEDTFQDPETTAILIYWLNAFLKVEKNYKMILPPDAWNRLKEKLERTESPEETSFLLSIIASIKKTNSTDPQSPFFREESLNPSNINQRNSNILSLSLPGWGSRSENDHPAIPKGLSQQERDIDHLAEAFAGWTLTKSALFRRMMIISSVKSRPLQERWHSWGHLISYTPDSFFRLFKIRRETIIKILRENRLAQSHSLPAEPTSTSNISAPGTTGTPVDNPANTEQDEYWRRPSEFRQSK